MVKELRELRDGEELRKDVQLALKRRAAQATRLMDAWYAQLDVGHVRRMAPADFKLDEELAEEVAEELIGSLEEEGQEEEDDEEPDFGGWMNRRISPLARSPCCASTGFLAVWLSVSHLHLGTSR